MLYDVVIVGGGIVGLATAYQLLSANPRLRVIVLEKESAVARHQTGHNSGVIHSGVYYKPGSAKAVNCVRGYQQLVRFCDTHGVAYEICGKLLVATNEREAAVLAGLQERGEANGLKGIRQVPRDTLHEYEPHVAGLRGLWVPSTGIVDYTAVAQSLARQFSEAGGTIVLGAKVTGLKRSDGPVEIVTPAQTYRARLLVNCGGLYSDTLAAFSNHALDIRIIPFRGEYYKLRDERSHLIRNLVYPVPDPAFPFLGVHFTRMIGGGVEAGPNAVFAFKREGYRKSDMSLAELSQSLLWPGFQKIAAKYWKTGLGEFYRSFSKAAFTRALQRLVPDLRGNDLIPGGSGVRAQACSRAGQLVDDFLILEDEQFINVCNAPSPAATSCLSIGQTIASTALKRL